ncbi:AraC family transcriptional regulator [Paenibacillus marchantiophytorum]|uniref:AraC family transcriptional regulator n=1 Tax=Paenibacillus marchantiophytorum TaxID=1619310 RepID=UPI003570AF95
MVLSLCGTGENKHRGAREYFAPELTNHSYHNRREHQRRYRLYEVAGKLYINASYLSRLFKQHLGQSFTSYIVEFKMKLAMQWHQSISQDVGSYTG